MTFRVRKRYKVSHKDKWIKHIRLFFVLPGNNHFKDTESSSEATCYARATIRHNKRYILFLSERSESDEVVSRKTFHLVSGPVQKSKLFVRSMKKYLCRNCGKSLNNYRYVWFTKCVLK